MPLMRGGDILPDRSVLVEYIKYDLWEGMRAHDRWMANDNPRARLCLYACADRQGTHQADEPEGVPRIPGTRCRERVCLLSKH